MINFIQTSAHCSYYLMEAQKECVDICQSDWLSEQGTNYIYTLMAFQKKYEMGKNASLKIFMTIPNILHCPIHLSGLNKAYLSISEVTVASIFSMHTTSSWQRQIIESIFTCIPSFYLASKTIGWSTPKVQLKKDNDDHAVACLNWALVCQYWWDQQLTRQFSISHF